MIAKVSRLVEDIAQGTWDLDTGAINPICTNHTPITDTTRIYNLTSIYPHWPQHA